MITIEKQPEFLERWYALACAVNQLHQVCIYEDHGTFEGRLEFWERYADTTLALSKLADLARPYLNALETKVDERKVEHGS